MANAVYDKWREARAQHTANSNYIAGNVKAVCVDAADYTFSQAHEFLSDIAAGARVATSGNLATKSVTNGVHDADDVTITGVTGDQFEAIVLYVDTGVAGTSRLICYLDTGWTGLPATPSGGDVTIAWNASGIFKS